MHRMVAAGACNDPAEVALMTAARPDVVLVFGTGILREPLLSAFDGRIINIHLGLSPYYRGAGTNFWPLVNREPEYVGATIHYLDAGIDTGPILAHAQADHRRVATARTTSATRRSSPRPTRCCARPTAHVAGDGARRCRSGAAAGCISERTSAPMRCGRCTATSRPGMIDEYLAARPSRDAALRLIEPERVA